MMTDHPEPSQCWRTITDSATGLRAEVPICGTPCCYGGQSMARKYSRTDLGWMAHCNRRVGTAGQRCWQHKEDQAGPVQ